MRLLTFPTIGEIESEEEPEKEVPEFNDSSNFSGANLNGSNLTGADFRTSKEYVFDIRTTKIKNSKFSFPYVASLITALGAEVDM